MRRSTPLLTVALAIALAACGDASPASIVDADVPVPGDPAIYAPDGWPLRIRDRVTDEDRDRLRKEFLSPYQWAIHVVGDQLYAARWDWPDEPHDYSRLVYAGHFPATMPWLRLRWERRTPLVTAVKLSLTPKRRCFPPLSAGWLSGSARFLGLIEPRQLFGNANVGRQEEAVALDALGPLQ